MITFDPDTVRTRIGELEQELGAPGFWDEQQHAARVSAEHARLTKRLDRYERLRSDYEDAAELYAMDGGMEDEIVASVAPLTQELLRLQEEALFHDEYDSGDAVVTVVGGTGGTDAQDWAEIVLRMYLRWAAARGFETELLEASPGEEAGLSPPRSPCAARTPTGRSRQSVACTGSSGCPRSTRRTADTRPSHR